MKKYFIALATLLFLSVNVQAQNTEKEDVDELQAIFGREKKELIADLIKVSPENATKFWSVYDKYEVERKALGRERISLIKNLSDAYENMTPAKADAVSEQAMKLSKDFDKLLDKYYTAMKKEVGAVTAFEFYQAESYILTEVRSTLMEGIPLYSKVKKQ